MSRLYHQILLCLRILPSLQTLSSLILADDKLSPLS